MSHRNPQYPPLSAEPAEFQRGRSHRIPPEHFRPLAEMAGSNVRRPLTELARESKNLAEPIPACYLDETPDPEIPLLSMLLGMFLCWGESVIYRLKPELVVAKPLLCLIWAWTWRGLLAAAVVAAGWLAVCWASLQFDSFVGGAR